jgi:hypothetical protein
VSLFNAGHLARMPGLVAGLAVVTIGLLPSWFGHAAQARSPLVETRQTGPGADNMTAPLYEPRVHGLPKARIEGGTRGAERHGPVVLPLVPDHVGLTIAGQPVLYWYLSEPTAAPVMFVLVDTRSIQVIHEVTLAPPPQAGVQVVRLKDFGVKLEPNVLYRWYLTVVQDLNVPSHDIVSGGMIERIRPDFNVPDAAAPDNVDIVRYYAEEGLWYDALASISDLIYASPGNLLLRKQRASLLRQVGLQEVAEWDLRQVPTD